jgi:hypothetical protein
VSACVSIPGLSFWFKKIVVLVRLALGALQIAEAQKIVRNAPMLSPFPIVVGGYVSAGYRHDGPFIWVGGIALPHAPFASGRATQAGLLMNSRRGRPGTHKFQMRSEHL